MILSNLSYKCPEAKQKMFKGSVASLAESSFEDPKVDVMEFQMELESSLTSLSACKSSSCNLSAFLATLSLTILEVKLEISMGKSASFKVS